LLRRTAKAGETGQMSKDGPVRAARLAFGYTVSVACPKKHFQSYSKRSM
jgi:hypothetical protein